MAGVTEYSWSSVCVILVLVVTDAVVGNYGSVAAQSTAPSSGCTGSLITLAPCAGYVTSNVTTSPPSKSCCTALSSVVQNNAACLCLLFTSNNPLGFPINQTRALALPGACKVTTPSISKCKAPGAPAPSSSAGAGAPAPSASAGSSNSAPTVSVPSSSPEPATSTPAAVFPSARSPTSSDGGISPAESEHPKTSAGAHLTSSTIISGMVGLVIVSIVW